MSKSALIVWGGWDGHDPEQVAERFRGYLADDGVDVTVSDSLSSFDDVEQLKALDLIVPVWTMGTIESEQSKNVQAAVTAGTGMAGCHGGMCDAFRRDEGWQFMTGGQWVSHPGNDGVEYTINFGPERGELTDGLDDFSVKSEQYYLHVDPAVKVYATTKFPIADGPHTPNGEVLMPQVWTKYFGEGRVYYNALGHQANIFDIPEAAELMRRGLRWAMR